MATVLETMRARYMTLMKTISDLEKLEKTLPEGSINVRSNKSGFSYILRSDNQFKYLNKEHKELIRKLIQKDHIQKTLKSARHEAKILKKDIIDYPQKTMETVFETLPEGRKKYASPLILNDCEYAQQWLSQPFDPKPFSKNAPVFYTLMGERVRSKSEVIIADKFFAKGIPYKYECPILIGETIIHPDFTILRLSDRKILYHEHCGKMGVPGYVNDMLERVNNYGRAGVFVGDRLFFTFESADQPLDMSWLDEFIEKNFR